MVAEVAEVTPKLIHNLGGGRGGAKTQIEPFQFDGVYLIKGQKDAIATLSMFPGESVYGEKKVTAEVFCF